MILYVEEKDWHINKRERIICWKIYGVVIYQKFYFKTFLITKIENNKLQEKLPKLLIKTFLSKLPSYHILYLYICFVLFNK